MDQTKAFSAPWDRVLCGALKSPTWHPRIFESDLMKLKVSGKQCNKD